MSIILYEEDNMDCNEIKAVIQEYFDAAYEGDGEKIAEIFNSAAHVYKRDASGNLIDMDRDAFVRLVGSKDSDKPKPDYPKFDEIISIDVTGENTAVARVRIRVKDLIFTDILCFIRLDGRWTIISKLYTGVPVI